MQFKICELCNKKFNGNTIYCAYNIKCCSVKCQTSIINLNSLCEKLCYNQETIKKHHIQLIRNYLLKKISLLREKQIKNRNLYDYLSYFSILE